MVFVIAVIVPQGWLDRTRAKLNPLLAFGAPVGDLVSKVNKSNKVAHIFRKMKIKRA